ncbi:unnamed protein product [Hymenolepis diminuta]|uniref:Uncharacterized protein n=1 Tax=Hymenolepis diminuta TaxID=6216 RepID=A0A564ZBJ1_HYMDI|nr:unnamed protein product [Hymenolepis diminuta]
MDDFSLKNEPRARCSKKPNSEQLEVAIDENPTCTTRELSKTFHVSHMTIYMAWHEVTWQSLKGCQMGPLPPHD